MIEPVDAICPDFRSPNYAEARKELTDGGASEEDAAKLLEIVWKASRKVGLARELREREEQAMQAAEEMRQKSEIEAQKAR